MFEVFSTYSFMSCWCERQVTLKLLQYVWVVFEEQDCSNVCVSECLLFRNVSPTVKTFGTLMLQIHYYISVSLEKKTYYKPGLEYTAFNKTTTSKCVDVWKMMKQSIETLRPVLKR